MLFFFALDVDFFGVDISNPSLSSSERAKTSEQSDDPTIPVVDVTPPNGRECALAVAVLEECVEDAMDLRGTDVPTDFPGMDEFDTDFLSLPVEECSIEPEEDSSRILSRVNSGMLSIDFETVPFLAADTCGAWELSPDSDKRRDVAEIVASARRPLRVFAG